MSDDALALVESEMLRILKSMQELTPGSKEFAAAEVSFLRLSQSVDADKKASAEVSKACSELDKGEAFIGIETKKLELETERINLDKAKHDTTTSLETKKLELETERLSVDKERNTIDKKHVFVDVLKVVGSVVEKVLVVAGTAYITYKVTTADLSGDYVSKAGLNTIPKIHL